MVNTRKSNRTVSKYFGQMFLASSLAIAMGCDTPIQREDEGGVHESLNTLLVDSLEEPEFIPDPEEAINLSGDLMRGDLGPETAARTRSRIEPPPI